MSPTWLHQVWGNCCPLEKNNIIYGTRVVPCILFWNVTQNIICGRWKVQIWPWLMVRPYVKFLDVIQNLLNDEVDVTLYCITQTSMLLCLALLCMVPCPIAKDHLAMFINLAPTTGLVPCQVQPGTPHSLDAPLVGRSHRNVVHYWPRWIIRPLCKLLDVLQNMLKDVAMSCHTVAQMYHIMSQVVLNVQYIMYAPWPASGPPTHGYWLDTYYWTYTMPGSPRTCSWDIDPQQNETTEKGTRKGLCAKCIKSICELCPLHLLSIFKGQTPMVINWTPTNRPIPCQVQPRPAHGPWPPPVGSEQMEAPVLCNDGSTSMILFPLCWNCLHYHDGLWCYNVQEYGKGFWGAL